MSKQVDPLSKEISLKMPRNDKEGIGKLLNKDHGKDQDDKG